MIKATLVMYGECIAATTSALKKNWIIIPASFLAYFIMLTVAGLVTPLGMTGGFILGLTECALLTLYYGWLHEAHRKSRLSWRELLNFDVGVFFAIISVSFIIWIAEMLVGGATMPGRSNPALFFLHLAVVFICNALPEVIYIARIESLEAFMRAGRFIKENFIEWYIPFIIIISPWFAVGAEFIPLLLSQSHPLLPVQLVVNGPVEVFPQYHYAALACGLIVANWFMLFRAELFVSLESGSRRRRIFQTKSK